MSERKAPGYWCYRIVQDGNQFGLYEVYYNSEGEIDGIILDPVDFGADNPDDIVAELWMAYKDAATNEPLQMNDIAPMPTLDELEGNGAGE